LRGFKSFYDLQQLEFVFGVLGGWLVGYGNSQFQIQEAGLMDSWWQWQSSCCWYCSPVHLENFGLGESLGGAFSHTVWSLMALWLKSKTPPELLPIKESILEFMLSRSVSVCVCGMLLALPCFFSERTSEDSSSGHYISWVYFMASSKLF